MSNLVDNSAFSPFQSTNNDSGLSRINFPEAATSPNYTVPMVSLDDQSSSYGRRVLHIDPRLASEKLKELNNATTGSYSPTYAQSPIRSRPPLGSILQTPPDLTPTRIPDNISYPPKTYISNLGQGNLGHTQAPQISESINDFLRTLPSAASSPVYAPTPKYSAPISVGEVKLEEIEKDQATKIQEAKEKADYRVKFSILRESYPNMSIPDPGENESIGEIKAAYKIYVRRIHVDSSVEQNKVYLLILWLIIDIVGSRCFHLPFNGRYVKSQYKYMQKYQMLLIELGERSYVEEADGWPVEYRLLAMAIFHGVIFALVQMLASKLGGGNAANDKMADEFREVIDNFLTNNKGADVLRRAEQASSDNPIPESANENASPPGGDLGAMLANFAPQIMSMLGNLGGGSQSEATKPEMKRPTTFGSRRRAQAQQEDD
jgi:hypothetical protein